MSDGTSIREVIEGASPGPWYEDDPGDGSRLFVGNRADGRTHGLWEIVHMSSDRMCDLTPEAERRYRADNRFIATFDPEHIALMEAEDAAVAGLIAEMDKGTQRGGKPHMALTALRSCHDRLTTYRTERGYVR